MSAQPGRFIVFEGLDGAGTTTQAQLLAERLRGRGRTVHLAHQPSEGPVGLLVRQILAGRAATPQADGKLGVVDERVMALLFAADRLDHLGSQIEAANRYARKADLTLFLYVPAAIALERVKQRGAKLERYETSQQMQQIEREYNRLVGTLASVVSIDGTRPIAEVAEACGAAVQQQLG